MNKKFISALLIAAAIAAVAVPVASASPVLTEAGTAVPVGASVTARNTGEPRFTMSGFTLVCSTSDWRGTVVSNSGTKISVEVPKGSATFGGTAAGGVCTSTQGSLTWSFKSSLCLEISKGTDNISITGCGSNVLFTIGGCEYSATSMAGTFPTNSDVTLTLTEQKLSLIGGSILVGLVTCGSGSSLDLAYDINTTTETTLSIS
jgi:hypothetical protein